MAEPNPQLSSRLTFDPKDRQTVVERKILDELRSLRKEVLELLELVKPHFKEVGTEIVHHISVNGQPHAALGNIMDFYKLIMMAFPDETPGKVEKSAFTIVYRKADEDPSMGELTFRETVKICDGTVFTVVKTDKA